MEHKTFSDFISSEADIVLGIHNSTLEVKAVFDKFLKEFEDISQNAMEIRFREDIADFVTSSFNIRENVTWHFDKIASFKNPSPSDLEQVRDKMACLKELDHSVKYLATQVKIITDRFTAPYPFKPNLDWNYIRSDRFHELLFLLRDEFAEVEKRANNYLSAIDSNHTMRENGYGAVA